MLPLPMERHRERGGGADLGGTIARAHHTIMVSSFLTEIQMKKPPYSDLSSNSEFLPGIRDTTFENTERIISRVPNRNAVRVPTLDFRSRAQGKSRAFWPVSVQSLRTWKTNLF